MSIVERHGAVTVVRPDGPLRIDALEDIDHQVAAKVAGGIPFVVIDLSQTPLIDGAGLQWILQLDETCCGRGGGVRLCNVGELCRDILRITAVGEMLIQFDDLTSSMASFT